MQKAAHEIYSFDEFRLDLTRGALFRGASELKLRPKSFDVLTYLAENQGRLVGKDEIIEAVWRETAVTDDSLVQCLKDIRHALGDDTQQIIKTVPRRGYIFEKEVIANQSATYLEETNTLRLVIEERGERRRNEKLLSGFSRSRIAILVVVAAVVAMSAYFYGYRKIPSGNEQPMSTAVFQNVEVKSISHVGNIVNNAISPDGKYIVYTTSDNGRENLWLRQVATDSTQQVVAPTEFRYFGVSFSRDVEYIYFLRSDHPNPFPRTLYRVPKLGGVVEKVLHDMNWCPSLSPDGRQMAFVRNSVEKNDSRLMIANADGKNERTIAVRSLNVAYSFPAWSPDGNTIAVTAGSSELGDSFRDVVTVNVSDGAEKTLTTRKWYWIMQAAWLADGSGLIMSANPLKSHLPSQLWLVSYPNGKARQITNDSNNYHYISLTADSSALLAGHTELLTHLWIAPDGDSARARRVSAGLGDYKVIRWTPDGKLLFAAFGNKNIDIYLRDLDGSENKQLTVNNGTNWGNEISPDNRYIVFDSDRTGDFHIWRMDADGANPIQLTNGGGEKFAEISPDGKWVVYTAFQDWTLWKVSIEGGEPVKIVDGYARQSTISPDGKWIIYMASEANRFSLIPFEGGAAVKTIDLPTDAPQMQTVQWSPDSQSLQFIVKRGGVDNLWQMRLEGGAPKQITHFASDRIYSYDWTDDGKALAVVRGAWTADMVLVLQQ